MSWSEEDLKNKGFQKGKDGSFKKTIEKKEEPVEPVNEKTFSRGEETFFIPGNVPSKKNRYEIRCKGNPKSNWKFKGRGVTPFIAPDNTVEQYIKKNENLIKSLSRSFRDLIKDEPRPVFIEFYFIRKGKHRWDFNNATQLIQDLMDKYDWIDDDHSGIMMPVPPMPPKQPWGIDPRRAGVHITPLKFDDI